ncbi:MAG: hypothetical protein NVS4B12_27350 [Ktedonobacteraceae bacterium]
MAELFDAVDNPHEQQDLHAVLLERTAVLQKRLHTFISNITTADTTTEEIDEFDDPQVNVVYAILTT